jgi:hypothetical protein
MTSEDGQFLKSQIDAMKTEVIAAMRVIQADILREIEESARRIEEWK